MREHAKYLRGSRYLVYPPVEDSYDIARVRQDLLASNLPLYARKPEGGSTKPQIEVVQSKLQPDIDGLGQSRFEDRIRYADINGIIPEQEPRSDRQSCSLPDQGAEMVFKELMSALGDLDDSTFRMPDVVTFNVTAIPVRRSLADATEQELEQPKDIAVVYSLEQRDLLESLRKPLGNISNTSSSQQSQTQPMLKNFMVPECGTPDTPQVREHMVGVCQPMLESMDVQGRISFKISSRKPALGMYYQPPWRVEAEAQRRTAPSTAGLGPRESRP